MYVVFAVCYGDALIAVFNIPSQENTLLLYASSFFCPPPLVSLSHTHTSSPTHPRPTNTAYVSLVMFSTIPPGLPATQTPPSVFQELFNMSLNFFYVNIAANAVGLTFIPSPGVGMVVNVR